MPYGVFDVEPVPDGDHHDPNVLKVSMVESPRPKRRRRGMRRRPPRLCHLLEVTPHRPGCRRAVHRCTALLIAEGHLVHAVVHQGLD